MSEAQRARQARTFRLLLVLGAAAFIAIGVWGVFWVDLLRSVLGLELDRPAPAFDALARLYGAVTAVVGLGFALAAAQPHRSRSLLVVLFVAPLVTGVCIIAGVARHEMAGGRGSAVATFLIAYCLLYFRTYPRVEEPPPLQADQPPTT